LLTHKSRTSSAASGRVGLGRNGSAFHLAIGHRETTEVWPSGCHTICRLGNGIRPNLSWPFVGNSTRVSSGQSDHYMLEAGAVSL
jgi:hypothetical protein